MGNRGGIPNGRDEACITRGQFTGAALAAAAGAWCAAGGGRRALAAQESSSKDAEAAGGGKAGSSSGAPSLPTRDASALPAPQPDPDDMFGVDLGVNMTTIDEYLGLDDVEYRDARMVFDPADWGALDADPDLTATIEGFEVVPYPYLATLEPLPVDGAYEGETLFTLEWDGPETLNIVSAEPNYRESLMILEELFPKDKVILLMCGGAGYAYMVKKLLVFLGWDQDKLYNVGGNWYYQGDHAVTLIERGEQEDGSQDTFALWRAVIPTIDFGLLHPVEG